MVTREQVLQATKVLAQAAKEGLITVNESSSDLPSLSGMPNTDALEISAPLATEEEMTRLEDKIDEAVKNDGTWDKIASGIGSFISGLVKGALLLLICSFLLTGCSTTSAQRSPVLTASQLEGASFAVFKRDHDAALEALIGDLTLALEKQARLIEDYEIKVLEVSRPGDDAIIKRLKEVTAHLRSERDKAAADLKKNKDKLQAADANFNIGMRMHERIKVFLKRDAPTAQDVDTLLQDVGELEKESRK